jgi:septum formation protein
LPTVAPTLILASTSPYRRELLQRLGRPFLIERPDVVETALGSESPAQRAVRLAKAKAEAVAQRHPEALVIGSDQVCAHGAQVIEKPGSRSEQERQLAALSGSSAAFYTAVCLRAAAREYCFEHMDLTRCVFRELTAAQITDYAEREPALDCAGGFKVEGLGISLLARVETQDPTALVGLPLIALCAGLERFLASAPAR